MNHNVSTYVRKQATAPIIKNRTTRFLAVGIALFAIFSGMVRRTGSRRTLAMGARMF